MERSKRSPLRWASMKSFYHLHPMRILCARCMRMKQKTSMLFSQPRKPTLKTPSLHASTRLLRQRWWRRWTDWSRSQLGPCADWLHASGDSLPNICRDVQHRGRLKIQMTLSSPMEVQQKKRSEEWQWPVLRKQATCCAIAHKVAHIVTEQVQDLSVLQQQQSFWLARGWLPWITSGTPSGWITFKIVHLSVVILFLPPCFWFSQPGKSHFCFSHC